MNKNIFLIILLTLSSGQSSLLEKVKNTVRTHMFTKKEMISGFCLSPLTFYAGLKTKEHYERYKQSQKKEELSKSLKKILGWTLAGGICNYTVYQNIEHLFQKMPLQKKKMIITSAAHSTFLLLYVFLSNNRAPNVPGSSAEYKCEERYEYKNQFSLYNIMIMGFVFIFALRIIELKIKNMSFKQSLLLNGFYFFTFLFFNKKKFHSKEKSPMKELPN